MILQGIVVSRARRTNSKRLPPGSFVKNSKSTKETEARASGSGWSKYGGLMGHWIADLSLMATVILYMLYYIVPEIDLGSYLYPLTLEWPEWVNWVGILGIWLLDAWEAAILAYNVNFTPCYKPMKSEYVLATGGPYRFVRHPVYLSESLETIFVLLVTGIWINAFGVVSWFALRSQAKAEEERLEILFGKIYSEYKARTGMFFPKIRR
jgi:protein-S-isoprenylcysteine O-methyltransferase Ste14